MSSPQSIRYDEQFYKELYGDNWYPWYANASEWVANASIHELHKAFVDAAYEHTGLPVHHINDEVLVRNAQGTQIRVPTWSVHLKNNLDKLHGDGLFPYPGPAGAPNREQGLPRWLVEDLGRFARRQWHRKEAYKKAMQERSARLNEKAEAGTLVTPGAVVSKQEHDRVTAYNQTMQDREARLRAEAYAKTMQEREARLKALANVGQLKSPGAEVGKQEQVRVNREKQAREALEASLREELTQVSIPGYSLPSITHNIPDYGSSGSVSASSGGLAVSPITVVEPGTTPGLEPSSTGEKGSGVVPLLVAAVAIYSIFG